MAERESPHLLTQWWRLLRPGDWGMLALGLVATLLLLIVLPQGSAPTHAVVRVGGETVARLPLTSAGLFVVEGPLGVTEIETAAGRVRVRRDPSPRQLCVRQGWLTQAGSIAICAPNEVSVLLEGGEPRFDTLNF